ncbi:ExeA family protein [Desulfosoma caldarium]|uniref:Type II secretory pathway predicted ATPase ExeA n=1 Tax=Desulfosoma caldarium TaxID=610254 RepID=A0A3N1VK32_9BACT|nr:AAA family ATPase [Desulfosoma caldarium]ROR03175.1 type II secretory pathway predicted ATPase ExeA [Desulfosoma caldarium]
MYLDFYGFRSEPFHITPDPDFLYLSPSHKEALAAIIYGVQQRKGFITITGEVGLGKTTIVRSYLERYDRSRIKTVLVFNANVSFKGLLRVIYRELGLDPPDLDPYEMVLDLHMRLIQEYQEGWNVVLIIDEAQNMPVETLENLRMLSNLESTKDKLLQIVLIGQPELEHLMNQHRLRQLKQRIAIRTKLKPLTPKESLEYIRHRLSRVQIQPREPFSAKALELIVREAQGIPRKINIICDNAFITGFGYGQKTITPKIVREVVNDLEGRSHEPSRRRKRFAAVLVGAVILALVLMWHFEVPRTTGAWLLETVKRLSTQWIQALKTPLLQNPLEGTGPPETKSSAVADSFGNGKTIGQRVIKPLPLPEKTPWEPKAVNEERPSPYMTARETTPSSGEKRKTHPDPSSARRRKPAAVEQGQAMLGAAHSLSIMERLGSPPGYGFWPTTDPGLSGAWDPERVRLFQEPKNYLSRAAPFTAPTRDKTPLQPSTSAAKPPARSAHPDVPQPDPGRVIDWILNKRNLGSDL